jgi:subtilisin family serine protease
VNADPSLEVSAAPDRPWEPERTRTCLRGRVLVKLAAGEAPERVPHYLDVRSGKATAAISLDGGGSLDRAVRRFSHAMQVTQAFRPCRQRVGGGKAAWDDLEERVGLSRTFRLDVDGDASVLGLSEELGELEHVESVTPIYLSVTPFDELDATSEPSPADRYYAHELVGAAEALAFEPGDRALIVAVVDSGVALHHPELAGRVRPGVDTVDLPQDRTTRGLQLVGDSSGPDRVPRDEMGHGTACASVIAARGLGLPRGLAGDAQILPARALAAARYTERRKLTAIGGVADIDQALKLAVDLGAKVINLSFGTPESALRPEDPKPHQDVVEYALARGCILVAASGNSGTPTRYFPAAHPGVIAVGSVGPSLRPSPFSTRGDHVALSAPGERIPAAALEGYTLQTGTSFAAPFVAAACALLVARAARYGVPLETSDARRFLCGSTRPFAHVASGSGSGILDVPAALRALERALGNRRSSALGNVPPVNRNQKPPSRGPAEKNPTLESC